MNKSKQVLILVIIAATATVGGLIAINPFGDSSAQANQGGRSGIQKWEYCAITNASSVGGNFGQRAAATIQYFQTGGVKEETVDFTPEFGRRVSGDGSEALSKAMAKLGDEGWEMVLKESVPENRAKDNFYFKRPKR